MIKPARSFLMLFVLLAGHSVTADATVFVRLPIERLTLLSSHVVTAKCMSIESRWDEKRTTIYTRVELEVEKKLRGELSSEKISLYLPGGTVGEQSVIVIGAPQMKVADEVVVMLERLQPGGVELALQDSEEAFGVVGLSQGIFEMKRDSQTSEVRAVSRAIPIFLQEGAKLDELPPGGVKGMLLVELEESIREIARREARMPDAQEREGQAEEGEGLEGQRDESAEEPGRQPGVQRPEPRAEAQEAEGLEETGAGTSDAPETLESAPESGEGSAAQSDRTREAQEAEGQEEKGEGPPAP